MVWIFVLSTAVPSAWHNDCFLVKTGVSALNVPFSSPTSSLQDHLLRKISESIVTRSPVSLKEKSKGDIVAGFSSIWAACFYIELFSCEVTHRRIWSLNYKSRAPPPLVLQNVIQSHCGSNRKLPNHITFLTISKEKIQIKRKEEKESLEMFVLIFSSFSFFFLLLTSNKINQKISQKSKKTGCY